MPAAFDKVPDKRGHLISQASGERELLVLRSGSLRIYGAVPDQSRKLVPDSIILLSQRCEISVQAGNCLQIRAHVSFDVEYTFKAPSKDVAEEWRVCIEDAIVCGAEKLRSYYEFLSKGSIAYKYNYSNSKRMRRHFWVDEERAQLCWGKARNDEERQTMDLKDSVGILYGPMTSTFQRCEQLEDSSWCCFSLLFHDRTLDLAVPGSAIEPWFMGLQHLLVQRAPGCVTLVHTDAHFTFRKVFHKIGDSAHRQGLVTRALFVRQLKALANNAAFREGLDKVQKEGYDLSAKRKNMPKDQSEEEAKAERRRLRKEAQAKAEAAAAAAGAKPLNDAKAKKASSSPRTFTPAARETASGTAATPATSSAARGTAGDSISLIAGAASPEQEEQDLMAMVAELERNLDAAASGLQALKPSWIKLGPTAMVGVPAYEKLTEVLQRDGISWQVEKCSELERELMNLRSAISTMQRQLQAGEKVEKQLKKLAKFFKDSDNQVQAAETELGSARTGAQTSETAKFTSETACERVEADTKHLDRRVQELQQQLQQATTKSGEMSLMLQKQNAEQLKELSKLSSEKTELTTRLEAMNKELKGTQQRKQENDKRLTATSSASKRLSERLRKLQGEVGGLQANQRQVREDCDLRLRGLADDFPALVGAVHRVGLQIETMTQRFLELAEERKKLHNLVLELKGNIRVFVRVRPISAKEKDSELPGEPTITFAEDCKVSVHEATTSRRKWFEFDKAFPPTCTQTEVFEEVKPLATSVLDGFNVCIFAYGQTGSGKTFTMTGNAANPGLNTRVLTELFSIRHQRQDEAEISLSIMISEIYNESIKDLFNKDNKKSLEVKSNPDGSSYVPGLTERSVTSVEEVLAAMTEASSNRTVMATDMNEESSRSHSIVQVKTVTALRKDKRQFVGKISLIDLAGSENVGKSGVTGQGMKEAQNINKSLGALGNVIQSLVNKGGHIPYRDSKLTMMLKDSLGGDSKTLMIVQSSPAQTNVTETLSSLNFAARARNVELGKAKRNEAK